MIDIKDIQGNILLSIPIEEGCERVEELMKEDYIQLSWNSDSCAILPVGTYIDYKGEKYSLLNPYTPEQKSELEFTYTPQFQSKIMSWGKTPFFMYTYTDNVITNKEPDWSLTDNPVNFMSRVVDAIKNETGEIWTYTVDASLPASTTLSFQSNDIFSALNEIANAFETEWWVDKANTTIHLSKASHGTAVTLEVGRNVNTPSVTSGKEGYYTRFYAFGSTRNITQDYKGSNTNNIVNKRLTLDPVKYPNGYKDIRPDLKDGEIFSKVLIFDEIYPSSKLSISDVRSRLMYRLDEYGNKIQVGTDKSGNPIYDQYSIWYFQISGFIFNNSEYDKETNPDGMKIPGKYLSVNFQTGALAGREFELVYHDSAKKETSTDGLAFQVKAGDFEIKFIEEDSLILPMMTGLVPADTDKVILFNIKMPAEYTTSAYIDLESALDKEIERLSSDLNNYQFQSNPVSFYNSNPGLSIGQAVTYKNGNYSYSTRVIKLVTKIDYDCEQAITIGNEKVKGNTQELKEEVASANKDLNLLSVFNDMTASLQQSYSRTQQMMLDGFAAIKNIWQLKEDEQGNKYALSKYSVVTEKDLIVYAKDPDLKVSTILNSIPLGDGLAVVDDKLTVTEIGGIDTEAMWNTLGASTNEQINISHLSSALSGYATQTWVQNQGYLTQHQSLAGYATETWVNTQIADNAYTLPTASATVLGGVKIGDNINITNGVISTHSPYELTKEKILSVLKDANGIIELDASLVLTGDFAIYSATQLGKLPSIMDGLILDNNTLAIVDDKLTVIGGTGGGLDETELANYLTEHNYYHAGNANKLDVDWKGNIVRANTRFESNMYSSAGNAQTLLYLNGSTTTLGNSNGGATIQTNNSDIKHVKAGNVFNVWDSGNANLSSVDWTAKNLTTSGITLNNFSTNLVASEQWVRVFTSSGANNGSSINSVLLMIGREYRHEQEESYTFMVTVGYDGRASINQLSSSTGLQFIDKVRLLWKNGTGWYIDIHYTGTVGNDIYVSGSGCGVFSCSLNSTIPEGYTAKEFNVWQNSVCFSNSLILDTGIDTKLVFNNTDGEKYTTISFRENNAQYAYINVDGRTNGAFTFSGLPVKVDSLYFLKGTSFIREDGSLRIGMGTTGGNAIGSFYYKGTYAGEALGGIGCYTENGNLGYYYIGWSSSPYNVNTNFHVNSERIRWKGQDILTSGNYQNYPTNKVGDGSLYLYAAANNEINFGGNNASNGIIHFGYRAIDSKAIPSTFIFGGANGSSKLLASSYSARGYEVVLTAGSDYWYRCFSSSGNNASGLNDVILMIGRNYASPQNEHYTFSISVGYDGNISVTQLSGARGAGLFDKIRVVWKNSGTFYIDVHYKGTSTTYNNTMWVSGMGDGTFYTERNVSIPSGWSSSEYAISDGFRTNGLIATTGEIHATGDIKTPVWMYAARYTSANGSSNMYIGNNNNSGWVGIQDMCSATNIGTPDNNWSIRVAGDARFRNLLSVAADGVGRDDSYGICNVTRGTASNFSYFSMVRSGQVARGIGISTSNDIIIGEANGSKLVSDIFMRLGASSATLKTGLLVNATKHSEGATPTISLAIGDNDTGFNWKSDGVIGIWANNGERGYWDSNIFYWGGTIQVGGDFVIYKTSDIRLKINPKEFNAHDILSRFGGVWEYDYTDEALYRNPSLRRHSIGLIAQNVEKVFPWMVHEHDGYKSVNYYDTQFISLLAASEIQTISQLKVLNDWKTNEEKEIDKLKKENDNLRNRVSALEELVNDKTIM